MIAALFLTLVQAPELTPELLVAHPGLFEGRYAEAREDQLKALEANPNSPWAYPAVLSVQRLDKFCAEKLAPGRLETLARTTEIGRVQLGVLQLLQDTVKQRRFSDNPHAVLDDLYSGFIDTWFCMGPLGRIDEPAPLWSQEDRGGPESELRESYLSVSGETLPWRPLERKSGSAGVFPETVLYPSNGGVSYMLAWIEVSAEEAPVDEALLEIWTNRSLEVLWNGELVHEELRVGLTHRENRITVPLRLAEGPNGLLVRLVNGESGLVGARLLKLDGTLLDMATGSLSDPAAVIRPWPQTAPARLESQEKATESDAPFASCVAMLTAIANDRSDKALAVPRPSSAEEVPAWLRLRHLALRNASHLPAEVTRRFQQSIENELEALEVAVPEIQASIANRLLDEDQTQEGLALAHALVKAHPTVPPFRWLETSALWTLDGSGVLAGRSLRETLEVIDDATAWYQLADEAASRSDAPGTLECATRAAAADGSDEDIGIRLLDLLLDGGPEELTRAERMIELWRADEPFATWLDSYELRLKMLREDHTVQEEALKKKTIELPQMPTSWSLLANHYLRRGKFDDATRLLSQLLEMTPDNVWARRALAQLGKTDPAEEFFRQFAPDREAALLKRDTASGASTALLLDSRLVYVREDGSTHSRTHQITLALDRTGTEMLQEQPKLGETRVAQVLGPDGQVFEPVLVNDSWVMPSLDPGDAVEQVYDGYSNGIPGDAPDLGMWSFESFEQPFMISRYVVYLPEGVPGRWDLESFEGTHEEVLHGDGVVHVFEMQDRPRLEPEAASPSRRELISWVEFGDDIETPFIAQSLAQNLAWQQDVADDVAIELRALAEQAAREHPPEALPQALFDVVTDHVLSFEGGGDTTDVWYLERGNPTGLLAALYEIAGIEFEWAVPYPAAPPELDADPERPFRTPAEIGSPCLRIANGDGEPTWLMIEARGSRFGRIAARKGGTRMLVLSSEGWRFETLPLDDESWQSRVEVDIYLQEDKNARVELSMLIADDAGPAMREMLSQTEPQNREQAVRGMSSEVVGGVDIEDWEITDLSQRGSDLQISVRGTIKRFVRGSKSKPYFKLTWPSRPIGRFVGEGEREWPFAWRAFSAEIATIRVHSSDSWQAAPPPQGLAVNRDGFSMDIEFEHTPELLVAQKRLRLRALELSPEELPAFAKEIKQIEDLDSGRIPLERKN